MGGEVRVVVGDGFVEGDFGGGTGLDDDGAGGVGHYAVAVGHWVSGGVGDWE